MLASSSCCTPSTLSCSIQSNRAGEGEGEGEGEEEGEGVAVRGKGAEEGGGVRGGREDRVNWIHVPPHTVSSLIAQTCNNVCHTFRRVSSQIPFAPSPEER